METELRAYRANPTDETFFHLYNTARPWLKHTGITIVSRYSSLSLSGALDDVVNEGALALSVSARRFMFFCRDCERAFINSRDLVVHSMSEHRRRGSVGLVSLSQFARTSARLAMRRTARRLYYPEIPSDEIEREGDLDVEDRMILEIMIGRLRERLSARARANLELLLRRNVLAFDDLRIEAERLISDTLKCSTRKETMMPEYSPEPNWTALNIRKLRESAREVLGVESEKRTLKAAYAEIYENLRKSGRELKFTCHNCNSLIDDVMERCWGCGLIFRDEDEEEEEVVEVELVERARKLGIDVDEKGRADLLAEIEEVETRTRAARRNVDLLTLDSKYLNDQITEAMPDGWTKKVTKQYIAFSDGEHVRRIAIFFRGLKMHFSVEDGFLDGFPDVVFFDEDARRAKHFGRTNYEYSGDTAKFALDLAKRVMKEYGGS